MLFIAAQMTSSLFRETTEELQKCSKTQDLIYEWNWFVGSLIVWVCAFFTVFIFLTFPISQFAHTHLSPGDLDRFGSFLLTRRNQEFRCLRGLQTTSELGKSDPISLSPSGAA